MPMNNLSLFYFLFILQKTSQNCSIPPDYWPLKLLCPSSPLWSLSLPLQSTLFSSFLIFRFLYFHLLKVSCSPNFSFLLTSIVENSDVDNINVCLFLPVWNVGKEVSLHSLDLFQYRFEKFFIHIDQAESANFTIKDVCECLCKGL